MLGDLLKISGSNSTSACVRLSSTAFLNKRFRRTRGWMPNLAGGSWYGVEGPKWMGPQGGRKHSRWSCHPSTGTCRSKPWSVLSWHVLRRGGWGPRVTALPSPLPTCCRCLQLWGRGVAQTLQAPVTSCPLLLRPSAQVVHEPW